MKTLTIKVSDETFKKLVACGKHNGYKGTPKQIAESAAFGTLDVNIEAEYDSMLDEESCN